MNIDQLKARQVYEQKLADEMMVNSAVSVEDHAYQLGRVMMLNDLIRDVLHAEIVAILAPVESAVSPELETVEIAVAAEPPWEEWFGPQSPELETVEMIIAQELRRE